MNKPNKIKTNTEIQRPEQWLPEREGMRGRAKRVKGVNSTVTDGN